MPDFCKWMDWELNHTFGLLLGAEPHYHPAAGHSSLEQTLAFLVCVFLPPAVILSIAAFSLSAAGLIQGLFFSRAARQ